MLNLFESFAAYMSACVQCVHATHWIWDAGDRRTIHVIPSKFDSISVSIRDGDDDDDERQ